MNETASIPAWNRIVAQWPLWAALLLGCLAAWMGARYLEGRARASEEEAARRFELRPIVVAARALPRGHVLREADLAARRVPARFAPSDAQDVEAATTLVGRTLGSALEAGDPLLPTGLEAQGQGALSASLSPGMRAVTLPVDQTTSFAGLLAPGDVVDLVHLADAAAGAPRVHSLLEGVRVIATGQSMDPQEEGTDAFDTVTFDVSPLDAQRLVLAQQSGSLAAFLRASGDRVAPRLAPLGMDALYGPRAPGIVRSRRPIVEFIIGGGGRRQESGA